MRIVTQPKVYLVGRTQIDQSAVQQFLDDEATTWITDGENGSELICELAGRICYMAFSEKQGRRSNREYLSNIISMEHGSVLEHAAWNFIITGVSRSFTHELIRHRAGWGYCLTGDTLIHSEHTSQGLRHGTKKRRLDEIFEMTKTRHGRSRLPLLRLRCLDESTGCFTTGCVRSIVCTGLNRVFRVALGDGKSITCSKEHRFLTPSGWGSLEEILGGIEVSPGDLTTWGKSDAEIMVNGIPAYKTRESLEEQYSRSSQEMGSAPRPRGGGQLLRAHPRRITQVSYAGEQMTYDIEMEDPFHNFVANGIITHNSQLSQRFVDESDTDFVEPDIIASDPELHAIWEGSVRQSHEAYCRLAAGLAEKIDREYDFLKGRDRRKRAREAARSVLPNATETKILVTANARALRHFIEYRGAKDAEPEIRKVAMALLAIMRREAPNLFADYEVAPLPDGSASAGTAHKKV
jgi:thymidylate synthase ThyX